MTEAREEIRREKTAIFRDRLSTPMQMLLKHQFLNGEYSVFDYGCGRGDDLRALEAQGIDVLGWDPHYLPDRERVACDIVNLGFVINVIEDPRERLDTLKSAFALAKKLLVVSVMLENQSQYTTSERHSDGLITSARTFQKYFSQSEIRQYVEAQTGRQPVVVAPGCLFVFRSDEDEQDFLAQRHAHRIVPDELVKWSLPADKSARLYERNKDLLEAFWTACLKLGRLPVGEEFSGAIELGEKIGSPKKALSVISSEDRAQALKEAARRRSGDLCVYFALNLFERRRSISSLSPKLQRDIKAFFGTYKAALEVAKPMLFSAGRTEDVLSGCLEAQQSGVGSMEGSKAYAVSADQVGRLPPLLRIYIGCAAQLYGDIDSADLVKIHIGSAKLTLTRYDDFTGKALPLMIERIKIDMRAGKVDFFEYGGEFAPHPLYMKSRYMDRRTKAYRVQKKFDEALGRAIPLEKFDEHGPSTRDLKRILEVLKLRVNGFSLEG